MFGQISQNVCSHKIADINEDEAIVHDFSIHLKDRGYRETTCKAYVSALSHFLSWLNSVPHCGQPINSTTVDEFLKKHLMPCRCPPPVYRDYKTLRAALHQLLVLLGENRSRKYPVDISPEIEHTLHEHDEFLRDVCGIAASTRHYRKRFVYTFLHWLFDDKKVDTAKITSEVLVRFITEQAVFYKPSSIRVLLSSLRSYLRFLQFKGLSDITLLAAVPKPPNWSFASLPPCLNDEEIDRFFAAFDLSTPVGKRDYAMARCLMDLGLRCHEVSALQLKDINWHQGIICIHHSKNRQEAQLPLPPGTGCAIVDYLCNGRPATFSKSIFVFHRAPLGNGVENTTVRGAIRRAFSRAGLSWSGTHILRHTMASKMVQRGITLKEIADVLRHRDINTTQIYAKINLPELEKVAMPWPGRQ